MPDKANTVQGMEPLKQAEEALLSQAQIIDQIHDAVISTDLDGYVTSWNKGAERMFGYAAEEALGQPISFIYREDQHEFMEQQVIAPLKAKGRHEIEAPVQRKPGESFYIHLSLALLRDSMGSAIGMIGYSMDITERKRAEAQVKAQAQQQTVVAELGQSALTGQDLSPLMNEAVAVVAQTLEVEYCKLLELLPGEEAFLLRAGVGWKEGLVGQALIEAGFDSQAGYTLLSSEPVITEDLRTETRFRRPPLLSEHGVVSGLSVIIHGRERPFGILGAHTARQRTFTEDEIHFLQAVANVLAAAIERKRTEASLRQQAKRLEILREIDQAILAAQSLKAIVQAALDRIRELVPSLGADVVFFDLEANQGTVLSAVVDNEANFADRLVPLEVFGDLEELRQGRAYLVEDIDTVAPQQPALQAMRARGVHSYLSVPLVVQGELIGSLNLGANRPGAYRSEDVDIVREVANSLATAIQQAQLFEQVQAAHKRLQSLSRRLVEAEEVERRRIARELHDEIGQTLTAVKINLQALQLPADPAELGPRLAKSIKIAEQALQQVRNLSLDLRPSLLDDLGLVATLRWYVDRQAQWGGFTAQFIAEPSEIDLPPELEIVCFRVVQEALTNVIRHAAARRVVVELRQHGTELALTVGDDGVGFETQVALERAVGGASMGLLGMQERVLLAGGQIDIESTPGHGAEIRVRFPLPSGIAPLSSSQEFRSETAREAENERLWG
jgi:PAS domain S-box-containing protein